jgi:hypothetical protein
LYSVLVIFARNRPQHEIETVGENKLLNNTKVQLTMFSSPHKTTFFNYEIKVFTFKIEARIISVTSILNKSLRVPIYDFKKGWQKEVITFFNSARLGKQVKF